MGSLYHPKLTYIMRIIFLLFPFLMLATITYSQVFPVDTIVNNGLPTNRIKFVFLSDGYQANELPAYINQVHTVIDDIFTQTPFREYRNFFNVYAIQVPSVQSGADHPGTAGDENSSGNQPLATVNTYFNSTFDYAGIHRLVVPQNTAALYTVLANNFPTYDQVVMLVNSPYYGGSGGGTSTSTAESSSPQIAIHEIGHTFAILADEYAIGGQGERPNRTAVTDPATIKWKNWLGANDIGIFPIGVDGWQRPHQSCKMQFLGSPFCSVCTEAFINSIYNQVTPIYSFSPLPAAVSVNAPTTFSTVLTLPEPNTLHTEWDLNGITIATDVDSVTVTPAQLGTGSNLLTQFVTDQTPLSRSYLPNAGYVFSQTWNLSKTASAVPNLGKSDKFYYQMSPNPTRDILTIRGNADYAPEISVELYSISGQRVYREKIKAGPSFEHRINMSGLADGNYSVVLRLPNGYVVNEQVVKMQ